VSSKFCMIAIMALSTALCTPIFEPSLAADPAVGVTADGMQAAHSKRGPASTIVFKAQGPRVIQSETDAGARQQAKNLCVNDPHKETCAVQTVSSGECLAVAYTLALGAGNGTAALNLSNTSFYAFGRGPSASISAAMALNACLNSKTDFFKGHSGCSLLNVCPGGFPEIDNLQPAENMMISQAAIQEVQARLFDLNVTNYKSLPFSPLVLEEIGEWRKARGSSKMGFLTRQEWDDMRSQPLPERWGAIAHRNAAPVKTIKISGLSDRQAVKQAMKAVSEWCPSVGRDVSCWEVSGKECLAVSTFPGALWRPVGVVSLSMEQAERDALAGCETATDAAGKCRVIAKICADQPTQGEVAVSKAGVKVNGSRTKSLKSK
jgi:hypothetical protein